MWAWIAFPIGILITTRLPVLPSNQTLVCLWIIFTASLTLCWRYRKRNNSSRFFLVGFFAVLYLLTRAVIDYTNWAPQPGKQRYIIEGTVASLARPSANSGYDSIVVSLSRIDKQRFGVFTRPKVKLALYNNISEKARVLGLDQQGMKLSAEVKLQPLSSLENGVGFDQIAHFRINDIKARGYIVKLNFVDAGVTPTFRQRQVTIFSEQLKNLAGYEHILALALGQKYELSYEQKQYLNKLGISHLYAISGLHISIIFACNFLAFRFVLLRLKLSTNYAQFLSMAVVWFYVIVIGTPISSLRAATTLSVCLGWLALRQKTKALDVFLLALVATLLISPYSILGPAWWLSFSAVGLILWFVQTHRPADVSNRLLQRVRQGLSLQFWLGLWLLPITVLWFQNIFLAGFLANLVAIPVFSILLIPLVFCATLLLALWPEIALWLFKGVSWVLGSLDKIYSLIPVDKLTLSLSDGATSYLITAFIMIWLCGLFKAGSFKRRTNVPLHLILIAPLSLVFIDLQGHREQTRAMLHILDVGQGTAAVVEKGSEVFLFDLGPDYPYGGSATERAVVPYLKHLGVNKISFVWVSHGDSDHRGALASLLDFPIGRLQFGCHSIPVSSKLQKLQLEVLWPRVGDEIPRTSNDSSCVVKLRYGKQSVLFPGDISKRVEKKLVSLHRNQQIDLQADILLSPHHGSNSSSSQIFIKSVAPKLVIHTNGVLNRYGFPSEKVKARYRLASVKQLETAKSGLIRVDLNATKLDDHTIRLFLDKWTPYWKRQNPFSFNQQIR